MVVLAAKPAQRQRREHGAGERAGYNRMGTAIGIQLDSRNVAAQTTDIMDMVDVDTAERTVCWQRLYPPPQSLGCPVQALLPLY